MSQNIFSEGSQSRTISINAQYQVLSRNPKDSLLISILARQLCPLNSKSFLEIYKKATHRVKKDFMILALFGLILCCYVVQRGVEKPHGLLNY